MKKQINFKALGLVFNIVGGLLALLGGIFQTKAEIQEAAKVADATATKLINDAIAAGEEAAE